MLEQSSFLSSNQDSPPTSPVIAINSTDFATTLEIFGLDLFSKGRASDVKRSVEEVRQMEKIIAFISKVFSGNYEIEVLPSPTGGWACGIDPKVAEEIHRYVLGEIEDIDSIDSASFKPKQILYDKNDLVTRPDDENLGVLRHEIGHAKHSDYKLFFKGQRQAQEEGYLATSWANIHNSLEDPWINNLEIAGSELVRRQMLALYSANIQEIVDKINTQPITRQLGLNLIYYWATNGQSIPTIKSKEVLDAFEKIKPYADSYYSGDNAQANFDLLRDKIWPIYKELEEKAVNQENLKNLLRKAGNSKLGESSPGKNGAGSTSASNSGGILSQIRKWVFGSGKSTPNETEQIKDKITKQLSTEQKKQIEEELKKQVNNQKNSSQKREEQGLKSELPDDIDLSDLPKEVLDEIEKAVSNLDENEQESLKKEALKNLDKKQAEELKKQLAKNLTVKEDEKTGKQLVDVQATPSEEDIASEREKTAETTERVENQEKQEAQRQAELKQARENEALEDQRQAEAKKEMVEAGFSEREVTLYQTYKELENAMRGIINKFCRAMKEHLPRKNEITHSGEFYTGSEVNKRSVAKRVPIGDFRVHARKEIIKSNEPKLFVSLVIDNSGSMAGQKMEEALKTAIFWGRVLKTFEIPFSIVFFDEKTKTVKNFNQDYDDATQEVRSNIMRNGTANGGGTNLGKPLEETFESMKKAKRQYPDSMGAVFVITDSGANIGLTGKELKKLIEEMQTKMIVVNFTLAGSGAEIDEAKNYFGQNNVVAPKDFSALPMEAFNALRKVFNIAHKKFNKQ